MNITKDLADPSNYDKRIRSIVLHYTVSDEDDSRETLKHGGVSAHFLIPKVAKADGTDVWQCVDEADRAWDAGVSVWQNRSGLNDTSIGIEIINYAYGLVQDSGDVLFTYQVESLLKEFILQTLQEKDKDFFELLNKEKLLTAFLSDMRRGLVPPRDREAYKEKVSSELKAKYKQLTKEWREKNDAFQHIKQEDLYQLEQQGKLKWDEFTEHQHLTLVNLLKKLLEDLQIKDGDIIRYQIDPTAIIGHSDIAPGRKQDPGPKFPWKYLAEQGIGAWPDEQMVSTIEKEIKIEYGIDYKWIQDNLRHYGYKIESTGQFDTQTQDVIRAFQMHFEPEDYSGEPNVKTISILEALIKKYYPDKQSDYPRSFNPSNEKKSSSFFKVSPNLEAGNTISAYNCCVIS
ncbi:N-acetylmuramoyl-L-alanine amidase [Rickettsiella endosymbiont of Rhagonycha lignosa]|uniref:N-acetylmuramoyl-L-alanine amidase n=1 Tax=Rickettsiella endosymbiont of Rhagonycha lignosa TaxID=3077937 RepID=UPI00313B060B